MTANFENKQKSAKIFRRLDTCDILTVMDIASVASQPLYEIDDIYVDCDSLNVEFQNGELHVFWYDTRFIEAL